MTKQERSAYFRALGRLGRGKPKRITPAEARARGERLRNARDKYWTERLGITFPLRGRAPLMDRNLEKP